jgi:hypothetical protein
MLIADTDVGSMLLGLAAVISAGGSAIAAVYAAKAKWVSEQNASLMVAVKDNVLLNKENILKIELATNSMKDALVKATGDAKLLEGKAAGRAEVHSEIRAEKAEAAADPLKSNVSIQADEVAISTNKVNTDQK